MSKRQRRLIEEEEKALKKIAELQDYVKELRDARKKEEDVEILRTLRSLKLGAWDLYNLLTGIQEGTVDMVPKPPAPDSETDPDSEADSDSEEDRNNDRQESTANSENENEEHSDVPESEEDNDADQSISV